MKRVVSVLLLACMLVSLMGMSAAAYAEELPDGSTAPAQETAEQSVGEQGQPEEEETPDPTGQPPQTAAPQPAGQPDAAAEVTAQPEVTTDPEPTEKPADEGFFAALSDEQVTALTADLAKLGYTVTDRAGLCALALELGVGDLESFRAWLDDELYLRDNAVAEVNGQLYITLDDALKVLENTRAAEIKLLNDVAVYGLEVPAEHELTLDLNDHTLVLAMQEGETAPAPISVAYSVTKGENGDPVYSNAALILKNGTVTAGDPNTLALYDAGRLTLANVSVVGGIHAVACYGCETTLSIEPGEAFKTGFVNGAITADAGVESGVSITGGDFITDVSAYIDPAVYECAKDDATGLYTVARIKGAGESSAKTAAEMTLPALARTEVREGEVTLAEGVELENAAVALTGLNDALSESGAAEIFAAYKEAAPAQTRQARRAPRALMLAAADGSAENADEKTAADGIEMRLTVKAELTAAVEGSSVSYEVKPYAVINGVEVPVKNEWLNGRDMLLSFYTGFLPKTLEHVHDDGTAETVDSTMYSYNKTSGMVTLNVREFSTFKALAAVSTETAFKTAVTSAETGGEINLDGDIALTGNTPIEIAQNLTINLNGHTLSMTGTGTDAVMFKLTNNATLTVKGGDMANSKLKVTSTAGAAAYIANIESGSLVLGDKAPAANMASFTASAPATGAGAVLSVTVLCAKTSFDPSAYVSNPYVAQGNAADGWTVDEYAAKLTKVTASGVLGGGDTVNVTYHKTLKAALGNVNSSSQIDEIELLRDIDLSAAGETAPAAVSTRVLISGASKYTITGSVNVAKDSSAGVDTKTIQSVKIDGDVNVNATKLKLLNVEVTGSVSDSNGGSDLELTNTKITSALTVGDGTRLNFVNGSAASVSATTGASTANRDITLSNVKVENGIEVGMYSNVDCTNVKAASLKIADAPEGSAVETNPSANIRNCTITAVTTGARMHKVELNALTATTVTVGGGTSLVEVKSLSGASNIGTLTIGDNCGTTTIEGNLNGRNTTIGTLNVGAGTKPTLGEKNSDAAKDQRLAVNTISCATAGPVTINSGTYETLNGDNTKNTFVLYGGNYPTDYSKYCACDPNSNTGYRDHYVCNQSAEKRYRVELLKVQLVSVTPDAVIKGAKTPIAIVVNVPYEHPCTGNLSVTGVDYYDSRLYNTTPLTNKDYIIESYEYTNPDGTTSSYTKITISGDYVATKNYQTYAVRTEMGKVSATATVKTNLPQTNRRSGLIRTGDDSNIGLLVGIMALALVVAAAVVVILKKKKSQTDANGLTRRPKPKNKE